MSEIEPENQTFNRSTAITLTKTTTNQLQYLERVKVIVPERRAKEGKKKPDCYYSWEQLVAIVIIRDLANKVSMQSIRKFADIIKDYVSDPNKAKKRLAIVGGKPMLIGLDWSGFGIPETGGYQLTVVMPVQQAVERLKYRLQKHELFRS